MSLSLLTFDNDVIQILLKNIDKESHLILGLVSKELYKILKEFNPNKKLIASLKYLTSSLSLLKYGHLNKCPWTEKTIDKIFTSNERLECVKYAIDNDCLWIKFKCPTAENRLLVTLQECLKYLNGDDSPWPNTCGDAASSGYLECLKYLHENGCPWDRFTCLCAAENGHLECLKYLHENGCPWHGHLCNVAAECGQLECLKYAHENGCPWDGPACMYAAKNGHLECLKYAHDNGCYWDMWTCYIAKRNGHMECLKYCRDNGCPE
jgi:hypothetical protein